VFVGLCDASLTSVVVEVAGEIVEHDVSVLKLAALKGIFSRIASEQVSYVNAPLLAEARGVAVSMTTEPRSDEYRNVLTIRGVLGSGRTVSASATLTGSRQAEKLVEVNGYDVEVPLAEHHIVMMYEDRPGIVAIYGKAFGDANINIAGMQIAREKAGGQALSVLTVDSRVPDDLLADVASKIKASSMSHIDIIEL
jgi:D-3-phosphoglycerate dehydrogenase